MSELSSSFLNAKDYLSQIILFSHQDAIPDPGGQNINFAFEMILKFQEFK
jgi:hypothetical protein